MALAFDEYTESVLPLARYPNVGKNLTYPVLGLCGEAGEVAEKVKKQIRDREGVIDAKFIEDVIKELGDVLWYVAAVASEVGVTLEGVAKMNMVKLHDRAARGKLQGNGDSR